MPEPDREQQDHQAALAIEMIEAHRESLAEEASEVLAAHPEVRLVGMILTPDSGLMNGMRGTLERMTGQKLAGKGFVGLVPRAFALKVLRVDAPATLDWITPHQAGPAPRLPLMAATRDGYRFGSVAVES